ncbi:profilin, required for normal timing of actin polymerization in response to thermal stress [Tulasnella sp. 419]|nr:profilin, required for normal timing of actin polymerization in response to thermal stress [Tulasnella sp. 418]KAG8958861.1 profilin, required for normal timing of actin polymerization in response to thermal stress [Tulasnella sp. 419]
MSWQAYVDTNLVGSGKVSKAAILGRKGGVWATTPGFNLSPEEQAAIIKAFDDTATTQATGVRIAGQKYFTLSVNDRSIYGKKAADGCVLVRTKQAILVTVYIAPLQAPESTPIVEGLADYLIGVGY